MRPLEVLMAAALLLLACAWAWVMMPPPPPVQQDQPAVLRRLELRVADLDKTHPLVGGERYRKFECREVP